MAIILREVADTDLPRVCDVGWLAFADLPLNPVLFPGPFPPDSREQRIAHFAETRKEDLSTTYMQAYDEDTKQLVSFAKWHVYATPENAAAAERPARSLGQGVNREACEEFFGGLARKKRELVGGKPHLFLHMLHTDPAFQRRGAGKLLLDWGTKKADELGLPIYLESSQQGVALYKRHGFEEIEVFDFDLEKYGGSGVYPSPLMIRKPKKVD
ncbi:acyl-CoA N-acyltransferase [Paraphoma chrysanthemicola]|uniref:Acyl-CoA N-acyltransferase n=1 Tax=Paraphoma chrysanthemicola TaxID=798071 RepID=A0A8K0R6N4_9PLEO|nr:acyl-CoA N-acyltransferase [Paraphoma chrysanthemicola]